MKPARRFHVINVGLPKTGTASIAHVFGNYRSEHERGFRESLDAILRDRKRPDDARLAGFLRARDRAGSLEMDSSGLNGYRPALLSRTFPSARFLFTFRDCYTWCRSMFLDMLNEQEQDVSRDVMEGLMGVPWSCFESERRLAERLDLALDGASRFWREWNERVLTELPPSRLLVVRTEDISRSLDRMASFAGVPAGTLIAERSHSNKAYRPFDLFEKAGEARIRARIDVHARPLMERFFPGEKTP